MDKQIVKTEKRICPCCMKEHEIEEVLVRKQGELRKRKVEYDARCFYCSNADAFFTEPDQDRENETGVIEAYKKADGLMTAAELIALRAKYSISQTDFSIVLGWGGKTLTRYESHQIQDKAHNMILQKVSEDPQWFLQQLEANKESLAPEYFKKYWDRAAVICEEEEDAYLRRAIRAGYAKFFDQRHFFGKADLNIDKVVDVIRFFAASDKVSDLYVAKLLGLMWMAEVISFEKYGKTVTGLVYRAADMGAVPVRHKLIFDLRDVPRREADVGEANAYHFTLKAETVFPYLTDREKSVLERAIEKYGLMSKAEIISAVHNEKYFAAAMPGSEIYIQ